MNENNLVTKANALITACYSTSLEELRIVRTLISFVQPHDMDFKPYIFNIADFINLLGVQDKSKYTELPKITGNLMKKILTFNEGKRLIQVAWLSSAIHDAGSGTITLTFDPNLKPYLLGLKEFFTTYRLENILRLTSKYSIRVYEILKSNEYKKSIIFKLEELTAILKLTPSYSEYQNLKNRVIKPAQKELAEKTDIMFEFETITARKRVTALKFIILPNPKNKPKKLLQEPPRQLLEHNTNTLPPDPNNKQLALPEPTQKQSSVVYNEPTKEDIETIKTEFKRRFKGGLVDKFVKEMIERKGLVHVQQCLRTYPDYIKGQDIKNVGGHFKYFVMEGYEKPVPYKGGNSGNKPLKDNFEQRKYTQEEMEEIEKRVCAHLEE